MKRKFRVALFAALAVAIVGTALAVPSWPPVPWGYQRVFYDDNGQAVGGIIACEDQTYSWGVYTGAYRDSPIACP